MEVMIVTFMAAVVGNLVWITLELREIKSYLKVDKDSGDSCDK